MAQIVIDIQDNYYERLVNDFNNVTDSLSMGVKSILFSVKIGTPLPKGHGRLIDANEQILKIEEIYDGYMLSEDGGVVPNDFVEFLEEAPTIIEADNPIYDERIEAVYKCLDILKEACE